MRHAALRLVLAAAIVAALAAAGILLAVPPLAVGLGLGLGLGVLAAYGSRLRRAAARKAEREPR